MELSFIVSNTEAVAGIEPITKLAGTSEAEDEGNLEADTDHSPTPEDIPTTSDLHIAEANRTFNDSELMVTVSTGDTWEELKKASIEHGDIRAQGEEINEGIKGDEDETSLCKSDQSTAF